MLIVFQVTVFPAVNREHQDVVIELVTNKQYEFEISQVCITERACRDGLSMTIPILEMLVFDERWSFIVMPR